MLNKEHILKDQILTSLMPNQVGLNSRFQTGDLMKIIETDDYIVNYLLEIMAKEENVKIVNIGNKEGGGYLVEISNRGVAFNKFGGYSNEFKKNKREKLWINTKIAANILNALIIIVLAIIALIYQIKS